MTWNKLVSQVTNVTAYAQTLYGTTDERVVITIPGGQAQLTGEEAESLGSYLAEKGRKAQGLA